MRDPIVGIDLGTSNSVVAHADEAGMVKVLADDGGYKIHPSVVSFHPSGGVIVGAGAKQRKVIDPQNTIYSVKRLIGRGFRSPEVQTAKTRVPYQIKEGANQLPMIVTRGGEFAVPEISAIVLDHMRNIAATRLEAAVSRAVVTVPASFNDAQRSATATAGAIAGLTVVRVLNEPTAAALAYGNSRNLREIIAVYDFGGGTFDITILKLHDQVYEVLGTSGDTFLGGDDLDERLVDKMVSKFLAENRLDLRTNEVAMMRLRAVAEQTKIELSRRSRAVVRVDEIAYGPKGVALNLQIEITREEFVSQVSDIIDRTFPVCREALGIANIGVDEIADVILVGGTTKIPYVRDQVSRFFNKAARTDVNPEEAVAAGAALQATSLERILSRPRRSSRQVPVPQIDDSIVFQQSFTDVDDPLGDISGSVMMAPADELSTGRPRRQTSDYSEKHRAASVGPKPDTSYSVARTGVRDRYEARTAETTRPAAPNPLDEQTHPAAPNPLDEKTHPAAPNPLPRGTHERASTRPGVSDPFETRTPSVAQPIARLRPTRDVPVVPPNRTLFGVPPGPVPPVPPPIPPPTSAKPPTRPLPAQQRSPSPAATTSSTTVATPPVPARRPSPLDALELDTQPLVPGTPSVSDASTLVEVDPDFAEEIDTATAVAAAASTARGMAPAKPNVTVMGVSVAPMVREPTAETELVLQPSIPVAAAPPRPAPVVLEVTPRGLGIATVAGFCEELIRRNSRVPAEMKKVFTTSRDRQDLVRIVICQGESRRLDNNTIIGDLILQNLPPRPRGETSIEVTFSLDASGILQVRARDTQTNTEQHATLDLLGGVPAQDVAASRDRIQQLRR